ncbi:3'-5' exonuclease domain-containing protein [Ditylenchus destructor]|nr:3'-5' exonuclease domain-containing protein [Ditylenchus destructor]
MIQPQPWWAVDQPPQALVLDPEQQRKVEILQQLIDAFTPKPFDNTQISDASVIVAECSSQSSVEHKPVADTQSILASITPLPSVETNKSSEPNSQPRKSMDLTDYLVPAKTRKKKAKNNSLTVVGPKTSSEIGTEPTENAKDNSCSNGEITSAAQKEQTKIRRPTIPSRKDYAEVIFGPIVSSAGMEVAVDYFIDLLNFVPQFKDITLHLGEWSMKGGVRVEHLLIQCFFAWLPFVNNQHRVQLKLQRQKEQLEKEEQKRLEKLALEEEEKMSKEREAAENGATDETQKDEQRAEIEDSEGKIIGPDDDQNSTSSETVRPKKAKINEEIATTDMEAKEDKNGDDAVNKTEDSVTPLNAETFKNETTTEDDQKSTPNETTLESDKAATETSEINVERKKSDVPKEDTHVISLEMRSKLLWHLFPVEFPQSMPKIWNLILSSLEFGSDDKIPKFGELLNSAIRHGMASFFVVNHCLGKSRLASLFPDPLVVLYALFMGPLQAKTIETFASNREDSFRADLRRLLIYAEEIKPSALYFGDPYNYLNAFTTYTRRQPPFAPAFGLFQTNLRTVMAALKNGDHNASSDSQLIHRGWAYRVLQQAAYDHYTRGTALLEQLNDVIFTVLKQRPAMKPYVLDLLENTHKDFELARKWKSVNCYSAAKHSPFPEDSAGSNTEDFLQIPEHVEIVFVNCISTLKALEQNIVKCQSSDFPFIGLDAEWSKYAGRSRASILQIALEHKIFVLDLDAFYAEHRLVELLDKILLSEDLIKIGFQFSEDLYQIRQRIPKCFSLFQPKNVICIQKLITQLLVVSSQHPDATELLQLFFPPLEIETDGAILCTDENVPLLDTSAEKSKDETSFDGQKSMSKGEDLEESLTSTTLQDDTIGTVESEQNDVDSKIENEQGNTKEKDQPPEKNVENIRNIGLSAVCRRILGLGLDKQEQSSVWDRRPLRKRQLRYAALDAYAMLLLYRKLYAWAERLGVDLKALALQQDPIHTILPLFWEGYE